jgi:hypothetical protein
MKISELLKTFDELSALEPTKKKDIPSDVDDGGTDILVLSGIGKANTQLDEHYFPLSSAYPAGDDIHHSKNPADMRSDSVSLYPGYGATK